MFDKKLFFNNSNQNYLNDHILFLMSLYFKKKNNNLKILLFLSKIKSIKFLIKIFILFIIPRKMLKALRS